MNLPFSLLAFLQPEQLGVLVPFGIMATIATIWIAAEYIQSRNKQMHYDAVRLALEKGQPFPMDLAKGLDDEAKPQSDRSQASNLRAGLIWLAVGSGIFVWQAFKETPDWTPSIGAIPGFVGLALLLNYFIASRSAKTPTSPPNSTSQP